MAGQFKLAAHACTGTPAQQLCGGGGMPGRRSDVSRKVASQRHPHLELDTSGTLLASVASTMSRTSWPPYSTDEANDDGSVLAGRSCYSTGHAEPERVRVILTCSDTAEPVHATYSTTKGPAMGTVTVPYGLLLENGDDIPSIVQVTNFRPLVMSPDPGVVVTLVSLPFPKILVLGGALTRDVPPSTPQGVFDIELILKLRLTDIKSWIRGGQVEMWDEDEESSEFGGISENPEIFAPFQRISSPPSDAVIRLIMGVDGIRQVEWLPELPPYT
ncbi:hypothetical protein QBC46DRAFT_423274 [Diplogelasinospora grovesii]|uniref:Uncharacterized protein n=1 Tax=Diplogelasinospora grovesii TaxID=303347 RepID=A0AAN6MZV1_9PEZI|nr:hypothetical protein QBC46DRAFT_423274 [Diplogelasinospora grovesii]